NFRIRRPRKTKPRPSHRIAAVLPAGAAGVPPRSADRLFLLQAIGRGGGRAFLGGPLPCICVINPRLPHGYRGPPRGNAVPSSKPFPGRPRGAHPNPGRL